MYVDFNPVHAGLASTPEESRYTSAYERITARQARLALRDAEAPKRFVLETPQPAKKEAAGCAGGFFARMAHNVHLRALSA